MLPDNQGGVALAVRHLLAHGHKQIGFIGYLAQSDIRQRYAGYEAALAEGGIELNPDFVFAATDNVESGGSAAAQRFLDAGRPCTALVVATDLNAIGVMETLAKASSGSRQPEFFSTHPHPENRQARIREDIAKRFPAGVPPGLKK